MDNDAQVGTHHWDVSRYLTLKDVRAGTRVTLLGINRLFSPIPYKGIVWRVSGPEVKPRRRRCIHKIAGSLPRRGQSSRDGVPNSPGNLLIHRTACSE